MIVIDDNWLKLQKDAIIKLGMYTGNDQIILIMRANWLNKKDMIYLHTDAYIRYMADFKNKSL